MYDRKNAHLKLALKLCRTFYEEQHFLRTNDKYKTFSIVKELTLPNTLYNMCHFFSKSVL